MADAIDSPTPRDALVIGKDGELYVETFDATGTVQRSQAISALDALVYLQNLIAFSASEIPAVPATRVDGTYNPTSVATLPHAELVAVVGSLLDRLADEVRRENPTVDGQTRAAILADAIKAAVIDPKAIRVVVEALAKVDPAFVARVWPVDEVLARPAGDPDAAWDLPFFAPRASRVMEGTDLVGPGGSPAPSPSVSVASGGAATSPSHAADPVLPFTGQFQVEAVDLAVDGIGLDLEFRRTYLHGARYFGPLGPRWDHSYNLWLREAMERLPGGGYEHVVYRSTGGLRVERFTAEIHAASVEPADVLDAVFVAPDGGFDRLEKRAGRFVATTPGRLEIRYDENLLAETLADTNGNEIRLIYDDGGERLVSIVDTCGRAIRLEYDDDGRLVHVVDLSLTRHVWYGYDEDGRLNAVWKSVDAGEQPMLVAGYRYWGDGAPGEMGGNLVALIDGRGREVLQLRYGDEPGFIWYDRVVEQRDGGITRFDYEFVTDDDEEDRDNVAVVRCRMTLPSGDTQVLDYSRLGRLVRLVLDDADPLNPPLLVTRWRYNADGSVVREDRADGSAIEYVYERDVFELAHDPSEASAEDRATFGRLRRLIEHRRPGGAGPPTRVTEFDYDPDFGLVTEKRGPYYGDVLGARIDPGPTWSQRAGLDARGNVVSLRTPDCTLPDGSMQPGGELTFSYDARGRMNRRAIEAAPGQILATELSYRPSPDLSSTPIAERADADGVAIEHTYTIDAAGRMVQAVAPTGLRIVHRLDHLGRLQREETWHPGHPQPSVQSCEYGPLPLPVRKRRNRLDPSGNEEPRAELTEEFSFDADGDVESSHLRSGDGVIDRTIRYVRDASRRLGAYEIGGVRFETVRDARGLAVETRASAGGVRASRLRSRYDALGRLAVTIDETGAETQLFYDGFGRVERVRHASGTEEFFAWNARDGLIRHRVVGTHPAQAAPVLLAEERQEHDEIGRVIGHTTLVFDPSSTAVPVSATTAFTHDRADRIVGITAPDGVRRTMKYDGLSRLVRVDDGAGTVATTMYDDVASITDEETVMTGVGSAGTPLTESIRLRTEHDAQGRVSATVDGLGNTWRWGYDSSGTTRFEIDPGGVRSEFSVDAEGLLETVVVGVGLPEQLTRRYRRDAMRRLLGIDGPRGPVVDITRDVFGRAASSRSGPESVAVSYDATGRIATLRDATGSVTTLGYGPGGAVATVSVTPPAAGSVSARRGTGAQLRFEYDGAGHLVRADDGANPVELRYDSRGLVLSETVANATSLWSYDIAGRVSAFRFPNGRRLTFDRKGDGRLRTVNDTPAGAMAPAEVLRVWALGSANLVDQEWRGVTRRRENADQAGRLLAIDETRLGGGNAILSLRQVADARGHPRARRLAVGSVTESMIAATDGHGRIVGAVFDPTAAIDLAGVLVTGGPATQADLDSVVAATVAAVPAGAETVAISLDPDGARREFRREAAGATLEQRRYDIDPLGRSVEIGSGRTHDDEGLPLTDNGTDCAYDAFRRLARVERNGALVVAIEYDALGRIFQVTTPLGATRLLHAGGALVETRSANQVVSQYVRFPDGPLIEVGLPAVPSRVLLDGQGSLVGLVDTTGSVTAWALRDPFGEERATNGTWPDVGPAFQGLLGVDGLDVLLTEARTYDPRSGAFRELDPAGSPDGLNRGLFANGNPLAFTDPSGLMAQPADQTGRPHATPGVGGSYGDSILARRPSDRPYNWAERGVLAMAGAVSSVLQGFWQVGLMIMDLEGVSKDIALRTIGFEIDYQARSGLGQMAAAGEVGWGLDVLRVMGKGIVETPGRLADAMEQDRPFDTGAEAMNIFMVGRAGVGMSRTLLKGGVSTLKLGGVRGLTLNRQTPRLQRPNPFENLTEAEIDPARMSSQHYFRTPVSATQAGHAVETMVPVSRWGRPGLRPDDWVMPGPPSNANYVLSFKWDPNPWNITAGPSTGQGFMIPPQHVRWPSGWVGMDASWKGLFNQRRYRP